MSAWWVEMGFPPFEAGNDGFPRPGQVLKHYRYLKLRDDGQPWSQANLAYVLGVSVQAVRDMENRDAGFSLERRRFLAELFQIPPQLFGIVTVGEMLERLTEQRIEAHHVSHTMSKKTVIDVSEYRKTLQEIWNSHHSHTASDATPDILHRVATLHEILPSVNGRQQAQCYEILSDYHQLVAMIFRDHQKFEQAVLHLDQAIQFANQIEGNIELTAIAHYRRGVVLLDRSRMLNAPESLLAAQEDFQSALKLASHLPPSLVSALFLKSGHVQAVIAQDERGRTAGLKTMDKAGNIAGQLGKENHSYHFKTDVDHYHIDKGSVLLALGRPKDAITELSQALEKPAFTRRNVYRDILIAQAYLKAGDYAYAARLAEDACIEVKQIHSPVNLARIANILAMLIDPTCPYKNNPEVARLGFLLGYQN